ncbi:hypothetical protein ACJJID_11610 [Microbulbifer sp. CnH-101-G]|uniref:hypothetical protein n=1 Tax=Microbulbifer sp. CnH-101-G TaxID=3243393 RepID=UPI00403993F9
MKVELGLFEEDNLLIQGMINITDQEQIESSEVLELKHKLHDEFAELELKVLNDGQQLIKSSLTMPIHESEDWESIELGGFTLAFWCRLNA